jgi:hypothetical protein
MTIVKVSRMAGMTRCTISRCFNYMTGSITNRGGILRRACAGTVQEATIANNVGMTGGTGIVMHSGSGDDIAGMTAGTFCIRTYQGMVFIQMTGLEVGCMVAMTRCTA